MTTERINELRQELEAERISYGELAEINSAAIQAGIDNDLLAYEILDKLEEGNNNG